ncbi:MAG: hypothetical protein FWD98_00170 [Defluviitaleaceae bacterium]|nr:hypothetical protein [Defluviitaleaceae bacterium]
MSEWGARFLISAVETSPFMVLSILTFYFIQRNNIKTTEALEKQHSQAIVSLQEQHTNAVKALQDQHNTALHTLQKNYDTLIGKADISAGKEGMSHG